eukprot:COSAG02_NODE_15706_length_1147_cov_1.034351_1_plen_102_part_10
MCVRPAYMLHSEICLLSFIDFAGDDAGSTIQLYIDLVNQDLVQGSMVALLDRLGKTQPAEEGVPSVNMEQLASATKDRAQATAEHAMQLASDAKNTFVEKAC